MELILQEDFPSLGHIGDKVSVRDGYARNFLIPRGIAVEARSRDARVLNHRMAVINAKKAKKRVEAEDARKKVEAVALQFTLKGSGAGRGFGSITSRDIEDSLRSHGIEIDRRWIKVPESLRAAGDYRVAIKLHSEVVAQLPVKVIIESSTHAKKGESATREVEESTDVAAQSADSSDA